MPAHPRPLSIWEITSWILPMAPEHFRRVLAAEPHLPQGTAGAEGGTRWFSPADLAPLRAHFATGPRKARYEPAHGLRAPLVALTGPLGQMGRSTALLHLAVGSALQGYRILVIEGDAGGTSGLTLLNRGNHGDGDTVGQGIVSVIAGAAARHLRKLNEARLDRGDAPMPMDAQLTEALALTPDALIHPSPWPGLDVMPLPPAGLLADVQIGTWRQALRGWNPVEALALEDLRARYDLILVDTPRGLGPLALTLLGAADILLAPLPLQEGALARLETGLQMLSQAVALQEAQAQSLARALGQTPSPAAAPRRLILPTRAGPDAARLMAGYAARLGDALWPDPMPEIPAVAAGQVAHLYDLDYRSLGRLAYAPLRQVSDAACRSLVQSLIAAA
jgi:chromosome partitioning protein